GMTNRGAADFGKLFIESLTNNENNLVISSLLELGGTVYAFILTRRAVPSMEGFHYGLSYLASILMVIPSQLMGGFSFAKYAALDIWLQNIHHMGYGPGFSLTAETYYNFGWVGGILFSFVIGYFFTKMFNLRSKNKNKNEVLRLLSLIFLYNSIIVARFPFHNTVRNILYIYLIPYFLIMLLYNRKQKDRIKTNF
ncbi:MAG TPA: O-antigen polysaccharide polymerase Wzy, partial [Tissierellia bacterium]|nr:O-antigen polysaccharide polymerase Wzy [Tissierellia bacterium]